MEPMHSSPGQGPESEADTRLKHFKEYAVSHPLLQQVDRQLTRAIEEPTGFAYVLVPGPSGVGKTTMIRQIEQRTLGSQISSTVSFPTLFATRGHLASIPLLVMETHPPDGPAFNRADYYRTALKLLGIQTYERRTIIDISSENTWEQKKERGSSRRGKAAQFNDSSELRQVYEDAIKQRGVRTIILDEAQHLLKVSSGTSLIDQLDWLKSMTNTTGVLYVIYNLERSGRLLDNVYYVYSVLVSVVLFQRSRARLYIIHVLIGTYELLALRNLSGQTARRGLEIHFPRYQFQHEPDQRDFQGVLLTLLQQVPLEVDREALLQQWPYFYERSIGCVGVLKDWIVRAVAATFADRQSFLTFTRLQEYALPEAQCESMAMEAASGEQELHYTASRRQHLWTILGMSPLAEKKEELPPKTETETSTGEVVKEELPPPKQTTRRGAQSPRRIPVGSEHPAEEKPEKCSFSGAVVELSPVQLTQAALSKLQCPECGAIWTARVRGEAVSFPPHLPPMKRRAQATPRWIRQGTTWTPYSKSV
jgi:hypothetical protein